MTLSQGYYDFRPQGFKDFYGTVYPVDELHVYLDSSWPRMWRVRGRHGDYGLFPEKDFELALRCAIDTKVTSLFDAKIYVHTGYHTGFIITKVKKAKPTPQFFQDNVP